MSINSFLTTSKVDLGGPGDIASRLRHNNGALFDGYRLNPYDVLLRATEIGLPGTKKVHLRYICNGAGEDEHRSPAQYPFGQIVQVQFKDDYGIQLASHQLFRKNGEWEVADGVKAQFDIATGTNSDGHTERLVILRPTSNPVALSTLYEGREITKTILGENVLVERIIEYFDLNPPFESTRRLKIIEGQR
jgi:hypothetical protein